MTEQEVKELLLSRRSMGAMTAEVPSQEIIEELIEVASMAPNHHLSAGWRFFVLAGDARRKLGEVHAVVTAEDLPSNLGADVRESRLAAERQKPLRAPVILVAAVVPTPESPKVIITEDAYGMAAGIENMLLLAQAKGLAAVWRTGKPAFSPQMLSFLGLPSESRVVGLVYLGYPQGEYPKARARCVTTTWL